MEKKERERNAAGFKSFPRDLHGSGPHPRFHPTSKAPEAAVPKPDRRNPSTRKEPGRQARGLSAESYLARALPSDLHGETSFPKLRRELVSR